MDLVGYRRNGHNELEDPSVTLPLSYARIAEQPSVLTVYANKLKVLSCTGILITAACCTVASVPSYKVNPLIWKLYGQEVHGCKFWSAL